MYCVYNARLAYFGASEISFAAVVCSRRATRGGGGGREEERGGKNALRDEKAAVKEARDLLEQVQTAFR